MAAIITAVVNTATKRVAGMLWIKRTGVRVCAVFYCFAHQYRHCSCLRRLAWLAYDCNSTWQACVMLRQYRYPPPKGKDTK